MNDGPWKLADEVLPFHPSASHVAPDYRDGWNDCFAILGPWREAVLDVLAVNCMDAPLTESPQSILARIIQFEVQVATDPAVNGGKVLVPAITDWGAVDEELRAIIDFTPGCNPRMLNELRALLRKVSGQ